MLKRTFRTLILALTVATIAAATLVGPAAAQSRVTRVALIVGPAGAVTSYYRSLADDAGRAAEALGAQVVKVYSPDATWTAVKRAVAGASIVVYLGHGNGWPSPYRDALYPRTQNGFGLNPVAGQNDRDHQYFGESSIESLNFASNAVVVFSHLCYASGNSEPGLAEGTPDMAVQRVDNYAAGFLRAGARAVVAEAALGPAYYVNAILRGKGSVESIWDKAPTANGHTFTVASTRTPGYSLHLDPNRQSSGFVRSLVSRGVTAAQVRAGAAGIPGAWGGPTTPSLAGRGLSFSEPDFRSLPIAGETTTLTLPLAKGKASRIPVGVEMSVRWDPLVLSAAPQATAPQSVATPQAPAGPQAIASPQAASAADPAATPTADLPTPLPDAPQVDLVAPEQEGSVVEPAKATRSASGLNLTVRYPTAPGLYRLSAMLHTPEGVAYDDATQALLTPVLVKVGGPVAAAYGAPASLTLGVRTTAELPIRVMNAGSERWDVVSTATRTQIAGETRLPSRTSVSHAKLVATWVSTDGHPVPDPASVVLQDEVSAPGGSAEALVGIIAPDQPGEYLLLLDVVSPATGPLSALGSEPAIIRISVTGPAAAATPSLAPSVVPSVAPAPATMPATPGLDQQPLR